LSETSERLKRIEDKVDEILQMIINHIPEEKLKSMFKE